MWMIDYGATWIKFYKVDKNKSLRFVSPPTPKLFFYLMEKVFESEGVKKNESLILGFPGVIKKGKVLSAPNLDETAWKRVDLSQRLKAYRLDPYIMNDTDLHGHLIIKGQGVELVISLGTGFGSSIYVDGLLVPNTELGHHPFLKNKTYEETLGYKAFLKSGKSLWIKNFKLALKTMQSTLNPDRIYVTGGMSHLLPSQKLAKNIKTLGNPVPTKKILKSLRWPDD